MTDLRTMDLRVQEIDTPGGTIFHLIDVRAANPDHRDKPLATLWAKPSNRDGMRELARLLANAPDMQRAEEFNLEPKRYSDPTMFGELHFTEVSEEEFVEALEESDGVIVTPSVEKLVQDVHQRQGIAEPNTAEAEATDDSDG